MSELVVVGFDGPEDADRVLTESAGLNREHLTDLDDAVVAPRDPDGTVRIKQSGDPADVGAARGGLSGALWGGLVGLLLLNPLVGMAVGGAVGAGAGALGGSLAEYGLDDGLMRSIGDTLRPGTSALFVLVRQAQPDEVVQVLSGFNGRIIRLSLSPDQEARLRVALSKTQPPAQGTTAPV